MIYLACFQAFHIKKYNLDSRNLLEDSKCLLWPRKNYYKILKLLGEELIVMIKMPFLNIVWTLRYFNLKREFNRVKFYEFKFGAELAKELVNKIRIIISSLRLGIQIFVKVVF